MQPLHGKSVRDLFAGKTHTAYARADEVGYELFDLREDPAEMNDLSGMHPDRLNNMIARWEQYKKDNGILDISLDLSGVE